MEVSPVWPVDGRINIHFSMYIYSFIYFDTLGGFIYFDTPVGLVLPQKLSHRLMLSKAIGKDFFFDHHIF